MSENKKKRKPKKTNRNPEKIEGLAGFKINGRPAEEVIKERQEEQDGSAVQSSN